MSRRTAVILFVSGILALAMTLTTMYYVVQLVNAIFGFHTPGHYNVMPLK